MKNIRPSERKRKELEALMMREGENVLEEFHRKQQELVYQEALEADAEAFLGRSWYKRDGKAPEGYRNGYYARKARVPGAVMHLSVPRVRNTREKFRSRLLRTIGALAERVRTLALEMYVRGLSTRDVQEAFLDDRGKPVLSRSAVSRLTSRLYEQYQAFAQRDLSASDIVFLFVDGVYESVRRYTNNQTLLCAWAICADGTKQFVHLAPVQSESQGAWESFFEDLLRRGLRQPLLVISDGNSGLLAAITRKFPRAHRQRCIAHKLRNIASKLPRDRAKVVLAEFKAVYYAPDRATADLLATQLIERYAQLYPAAVACFSDDLEACLTHLLFPEGHRHYIRTTNLLERTFEEQKRRTKVFPQHQHERSAVGLVFAVLERAARSWQRVTMSSLELAQLKAIRDLIPATIIDHNYISYRIAA